MEIDRVWAVYFSATDTTKKNCDGFSRGGGPDTACRVL